MNGFLLSMLVGLLLAVPASVYSQPAAPVFDERAEIPELISFFAPFVLPKVVQDVYHLKEYIRSEEFTGFKKSFGDLSAVDAIFDKAMRLSWNNAYEALFISLAATMDHRRFGVKLPVVGPLLWFPLTSEFEEEFRSRVSALPKTLYDDSPAGAAGDRDKLQHFFGSAFLAYTFESRDVAERIGSFIEWGEDKIIVDGALDERDFRANRHGQEFGLRLLEDKNVLPSAFLRYSIAGRDSVSVPPCGALDLIQEDR
ncbi:MAG: hypothetical protein KF749_00150 [Bacteroidetes bacterium]|nr:hypothetical protein [Bacteroidota bacterium]MCW5897242.1 hypothetical protein [Bacteroidota bacterium]